MGQDFENKRNRNFVHFLKILFTEKCIVNTKMFRKISGKVSFENSGISNLPQQEI